MLRRSKRQRAATERFVPDPPAWEVQLPDDFVRLLLLTIILDVSCRGRMS